MQLGRKLLVRHADGVTLSDEGQESLPDLEEIVSRARRLGRGRERAPELSVAASPPTSELFLPALAEPGMRLRALELPAAAIRAYAARNLFDVALTTGPKTALPPSWVSRPVGRLRKALFGTRALLERLGSSPLSSARLAGVPFVQLGHCLAGEFVDADDDEGPVPVCARRVAHEAATLSLCFTLAARTDSLVFGPALAARSFLEAGLLVPIPVPGWDIEQTLLLACNQDRVKAS